MDAEDVGDPEEENECAREFGKEGRKRLAAAAKRAGDHHVECDKKGRDPVGSREFGSVLDGRRIARKGEDEPLRPGDEDETQSANGEHAERGGRPPIKIRLLALTSAEGLPGKNTRGRGVAPRKRRGDLLFHPPTDVVGCVDFGSEGEKDRVEGELRDDFGESLADPWRADDDELFCDGEIRRTHEGQFASRTGNCADEDERCERVRDGRRGRDADHREFGKRTETEREGHGSDDVQNVCDAVCVHRRSGIAGALDRARGDQRDVIGGRSEQDDREIQPTDPDHFTIGSQHRNSAVAKKQTEDEKGNSGEYTQ